MISQPTNFLEDLKIISPSKLAFNIRVHDVVHYNGINRYAVILAKGFGSSNEFIRTEISATSLIDFYNHLLKESEIKFNSNYEHWEDALMSKCSTFNYYPINLSSDDGLESISIIGNYD